MFRIYAATSQLVLGILTGEMIIQDQTFNWTQSMIEKTCRSLAEFDSEDPNMLYMVANPMETVCRAHYLADSRACADQPDFKVSTLSYLLKWMTLYVPQVSFGKDFIWEWLQRFNSHRFAWTAFILSINHYCDRINHSLSNKCHVFQVVNWKYCFYLCYLE